MQIGKVWKPLEVFTSDELKHARAIYRAYHSGCAQLTSFADRFCAEILTAPVLERIEKQLGQQMNPRYIAYAVEYCFLQEERR